MNGTPHMHPQDDTVRRDPQFGPYIPGQWVPAPRYVLRRDRLLAHLGERPRGSILEIGYGSGALLCELGDDGFQATGLDTSDDALSVASRFAQATSRVTLATEPGPDWTEAFDFLLACEVLEHIAEDVSTLCDWTRWVKPGGTVIIAVPAYPWLWGPHDRMVGHYRRYTRTRLHEIARQAGLNDATVESYGFPLGIPLTLLRNVHAMAKLRSRASMSYDQRTGVSGTDRKLANRLFGLQMSAPIRLLLRATCAMQAMARRFSVGDGLILFASKPGESVPHESSEDSA